MMTVPNDHLILDMPRDCTKDKLFHHLSRDGGEADWSIVTWAHFLTVFEDGSNTSILQVFR